MVIFLTVVLFLGIATGWIFKSIFIEDQAKKYGVLNISGMKFVRYLK